MEHVFPAAFGVVEHCEKMISGKQRHLLYLLYRYNSKEDPSMKALIPTGARAAATFGDWTLYELPPRDADSFLWLKFKLMLPPNLPRKRGQYRVFRLNWHAADTRFAKDAKLMQLQAALPDLFARVETWLTLNRDADSLLADADQIIAERQRLAQVRRERKGVHP